MTQTLPAAQKKITAEKNEILMITNADLRESANLACWPVQEKYEEKLQYALGRLGYQLKRAHNVDKERGHGFISSQRQGSDLFAKVMNVPRRVLVPIIFALCSVGAYSVNHDMTDVFVMMGAGILAYIMIKLDFSMSPIVIGIILGPMAESNFRRALVISEGDPSIFLTRPVCAVFLSIALVTLLLPIIGPRLKALWRKQLS